MKTPSRLAISCLLSTPVLVPAAGVSAPAGAAARPNIIFVLVDDMGWGDLSCNWKYGAKFKNRKHTESFKTPSLDKMASEGMLLLRHYTACPVSAPARASLMTGVHQGHTRQVRDNTFDTPIANVHTLGSVLQGAGYSTAVIGKWGIGGVGAGAGGATGYGRPLKRGFDYFYGIFDHLAGHFHYPANGGRYVWENETDVTGTLKNGYAYSTDLFTARAKDWIVQHQKKNPQQPFFLYLAYPAPHGALRTPTCEYPKGGGLKGGVQWTESGTVNTALTGTPDSYIHPDNKAFQTDAARRHSTMIRRVDDGVGDIFHLLKDLKIDDNTLVVFTSDNGPHREAGVDCKKTAYYAKASPAQDPCYFKSFGMMDGIKRDCYEGGVRMPTIVRWPKFIPKKKESTEPSQFQDWMATFADAAGVEIPSRSDGVSLLPTLTGTGKQFPGQIYVEYSFAGKSENFADFLQSHRGQARQNQLIVWVDGYKGLCRGATKETSFSALKFEIYDTLKDPQETKDLAGTSAKFGEEMQKKFREKVLRSRRAFDGLPPEKYTHGLDFSEKAFLSATPVPAIGPKVADEPMGNTSYKVFSSAKNFPWVPDFRQTHLVPVKQGSARWSPGENILPEGFASVPGARGILFEGQINVPETGHYLFTLKTDSAAGSKAFVHLYDMQLIDADKLYVSGSQATSYMNVGTENPKGKKRVYLEAGRHTVRIEYICAAGNPAPSLSISWEQGN